MSKITSSLFLAILLVFCLHVASAQAGLVRTCVSMAKGSDANAANSCHCTTPCRTFATAHANTLSDGEITVLDPGDYGGLTITKSISINNDSGGEASITVSGNTAGITVNAPNGAGYVNLRGITIQGVGFGNNTQIGLLFNTGFSLTMTNCVVRNIIGHGIGFAPNASSNFAVSNTLVADNGGIGIVVLPTGSGTVKADFNRVEVFTNSGGGIVVTGITSTGTINAGVTDSVIANNSDVGIGAGSLTDAATTSLMVVRSAVVNNVTGLIAGGAPATLRVGESTLTGNTTSWSASGGAILRSYGDNDIDGNGDGNPAPASIPKKEQPRYVPQPHTHQWELPMFKITSSLFLAAVIALCLHVASAQAQLVRTCVSLAKGNDANASTSCHCTTPCRSFATAAANTLADGEITVLDPGDYGGLTITRSISINNDSGGEASITVSGNTTGIIVNAPNGAGYVNLRGVTIQGVGFGTTTGLRFNTGFSLTMTNCVVRNHTSFGIDFRPNASSNLAVSNTLVADNGQDGILVFPSGSGINVKVALNRVKAYNNSVNGIHVDGAIATGTVNATVSESVAANNSQGFRVSASSGSAATTLMVVRSVAANNGTGIFVSSTASNAIARISQSTVTGNNSGFQVFGGSVLSYGDNNIDGNAGSETPTGTIVKK